MDTSGGKHQWQAPSAGGLDARLTVGQAPRAHVKFFFHKWLARPEKPGYHFFLGNNATTGP
jgi:hypothetical protein